MDKMKLEEMKSSDYHKIVAQVLEIVEKTQFNPDRNVEIKEAGSPDIWKMVFQKKDTSLDELQGIMKQLGSNFIVNISAKDKNALLISIEAPSDDFIRLKDKAGQQPRGMFDQNGGQ